MMTYKRKIPIAVYFLLNQFFKFFMLMFCRIIFLIKISDSSVFMRMKISERGSRKHFYFFYCGKDYTS